MISERVDFDLYLITDRLSLPPERLLLSALEQALEGGVRAVQLREKDLSAKELFELAVQIRALTRRYNARLLINDRLDIAQAVDADGVHLAHNSLPVAHARKLLGPRKLIGVSTHQMNEIHAAAQNGADFLTFSPIYQTPSKVAYGPPQGIERLRRACQSSRLPIFALGGIGLDRIHEVRNAGAYGAAVISAIFSAADPSNAARLLTSN